MMSDIKDMWAYADNPASSGYVPIHPSTLRRWASYIEGLESEIAKRNALAEDAHEYVLAQINQDLKQHIEKLEAVLKNLIDAEARITPIAWQLRSSELLKSANAARAALKARQHD